MLDKITIVLAYPLIILVGLLMMPYLLCLAWMRIIALKKQGRRLDLDLGG